MGFRTLEMIPFSKIFNEPELLEKGLNVRLSRKEKNKIEVNLPVFHNVKTITELYNIILKYQNNYEFILHKDINPTIIGSISKLIISDITYFVIETYNNFSNREIVSNRYIFIDWDSHLQFIWTKSTEKSNFLINQIVKEIRNVNYKTYNIEFVIDNDELYYTDFNTTENNKDKLLTKTINN